MVSKLELLVGGEGIYRLYTDMVSPHSSQMHLAKAHQMINALTARTLTELLYNP